MKLFLITVALPSLIWALFVWRMVWPKRKQWTCPDCGYKRMPWPPKDYNICPKCMVEFGNDDKASIAAEQRYFNQSSAGQNLSNLR
jgi:hypothetical protein